MQYWQKDRNYRKHVNSDGTVQHVITVDGEDVEVTAEIYAVYAQADRRERYCYEREDGLLLSLERLADDNMTLEHLTNQRTESAEDNAIRKIMAESAMDILLSLPQEDQQLIRALVLNGVTEQQYADQIGITQKGVNKRKQKILKNIFQILVLNPGDFRDGE